MTVQAHPAIWKPLDAVKDEIRLAILDPNGDIDQPASCTLTIVSLDSKPDFEAISYVWGDPEVTVPMMLHGVEWPITISLDLALRHLRHQTVQKTFWVDAICINQRDIEERNNQVPLMNYIYNKAARVRIWLGQDTGRGAFTLRIFEYYKTGSSAEREDVMHRAPLALKELTSLPWWHRIWVVQEVALAREAIFHLGRLNIPVDEFLTETALFYTIYANTYFEDNSFDTLEASDKLSIKNLITLVISLTFFQTHEPYSEDWSRCLEILKFSSNRDTSDDRDRVYGLLAICPAPMQDHLPINYNYFTEKIYQTFAFEFIRLSGSLAILGLVARSPNIRFGLPSWVPDWRVKGTYHHRIGSHHSKQGFCGACGGQCLKKIGLLEGGVLRLKGFVVDTIIDTGISFHRRARTDVCLAMRDWSRLCRTGSLWTKQTRYVMGGSVDDVYWRTLLKNVVPGGKLDSKRRCRGQDRTDFDRWTRDLMGDADVSGELHDHILGSNSGEYMIISEKGYIGMADADTNVGDIICLLPGGSYPFILRPSLNVSRPNTFTLVEQAYIHGIMDGQAFVGPSTMAELSPEEQLRLKAFGGKGPDSNSGRRELVDIFLE